MDSMKAIATEVENITAARSHHRVTEAAYLGAMRDLEKRALKMIMEISAGLV